MYGLAHCNTKRVSIPAKIILNFKYVVQRQEHTVVAPVQPLPPHCAQCGAVPEPPAAVVVVLAEEDVEDGWLEVVGVPGADVGLTGD